MNAPNIYSLVLRSVAGVRGTSQWKRGNCHCCEAKGEGRDTKKKFAFNSATNGYCCLRCKTKGRLRKGDYQSVETYEVVDTTQSQAPTPISAPLGYAPLYQDGVATRSDLEFARKFVASRGVSVEAAKALKFGATRKGEFAGRLIMPIVASDGSWLGFSSRIVDGNPRSIKYKYPVSMQRDKLLFNAQALVANHEFVYVVEGALDAAYLYPNAVALLGTPSQTQINMLAKSSARLCVVMDGDAWELGARIALRLRLYGACAGSIRLPVGLDPDDTDREKLHALARESFQKSSPIMY